MAAAAAASADPHKAVTIRSSVQPSICNQAMIIWWQSRFYWPKNESNARQRDVGNQIRRIRECMYCHAINVSVALHFDLRFWGQFFVRVYRVYDLDMDLMTLLLKWYSKKKKRSKAWCTDDEEGGAGGGGGILMSLWIGFTLINIWNHDHRVYVDRIVYRPKMGFLGWCTTRSLFFI